MSYMNVLWRWLTRVKPTLVLLAGLIAFVPSLPLRVAAQEPTPAWLAAAQAQAGQIPPTATNSSTASISNAATTSSSASQGVIPALIPQTQNFVESTGIISSYQPDLPDGTVTANNAFFQQLGTNQRTCFTCHVPQNDWSITRLKPISPISTPKVPTRCFGWWMGPIARMPTRALRAIRPRPTR